MINTSDNRSI